MLLTRADLLESRAFNQVGFTRSRHSWLDDPRRGLETQKHGGPVVVCNSGIDRGRADALVAEVVLDELERHAGIEQVGGDGMPETVAGELRAQPCRLPGADKERLDLPLLEWAAA